MEFCPVCILRKALAGGVESGESSPGDTLKPMPEKPAWNINAGYVQRAAHVLPKSGTHRPWNVRHNYVLDAIDHRFDRIEESMVFGRVKVEEATSA